MDRLPRYNEALFKLKHHGRFTSYFLAFPFKYTFFAVDMDVIYIVENLCVLLNSACLWSKEVTSSMRNIFECCRIINLK